MIRIDDVQQGKHYNGGSRHKVDLQFRVNEIFEPATPCAASN